MVDCVDVSTWPSAVTISAASRCRSSGRRNERVADATAGRDVTIPTDAVSPKPTTAHAARRPSQTSPAVRPVPARRGGLRYRDRSPQLAQIDDDAAVGRAVASPRVPAATYGELGARLTSESHNARDVVGIRDTDDRGRVPVDAAEHDRACLVVVGIGLG